MLYLRSHRLNLFQHICPLLWQLILAVACSCIPLIVMRVNVWGAEICKCTHMCAARACGFIDIIDLIQTWNTLIWAEKISFLLCTCFEFNIQYSRWKNRNKEIYKGRIQWVRADVDDTKANAIYYRFIHIIRIFVSTISHSQFLMKSFTGPMISNSNSLELLKWLSLLELKCIAHRIEIANQF